MTQARDIAGHYTHGALIDAIRAGLAGLGKTEGNVTLEDLAPIDEFHIGGRVATGAFLDQLGLARDMHVLDIGCGLGGPARFAASRYGCRVTGIDLTPEYVATGNTLCHWVGLDEQVKLKEASALALPFENGSFDAAYLLHVGMNIADKAGLCAEVGRVLRPGAPFGIYDVMRTGEGELSFPVPWAATAATSFVAAPAEYGRALEAAGFSVRSERSRREFALAFFAELKAKIAAAGGPPPLGLHVLMGATAPVKVKNMLANISAGLIAPVEIVARKP
jgi:ubiquinone/menaquinone biosynthesis C-methylase UbiE